MNMADLCKIVARDSYSGVAGPVTEEIINEAEAILGLPIRGSYREFIKQVGSMLDDGFMGLDSREPVKDVGLCAFTKMGREEYDFKDEWIMVFFDFDLGAAGALDTSKINEAGEAPVLMMDVDITKLNPGHKNLHKYADSFYEAVMKYFEVTPDDEF